MKTTILVFLLFISSIHSQNVDFSLNAVDEQSLYNHSRNIANSSTLWFAGSINTLEPSEKMLYIKYSQTSPLKKINNNYWVLPNLQFGLMPTSNLMLSGNFFGMHLKKDILQIHFENYNDAIDTWYGQHDSGATARRIHEKMISEQPRGLDTESDKLSRRLNSQKKSLEKDFNTSEEIWKFFEHLMSFRIRSE